MGENLTNQKKGGYGKWIILGSMYLGFLAYGLQSYVIGAAWPTMRVELGLGIDDIGQYIMIRNGMCAVGCLVSGWLVSKFRTGRYLGYSYLAFGLLMASVMICGNAMSFALVLVPLGFARGLLDGGCNEYTAHEYSPRAMQFLHVMWGCGSFLGPVVIVAAMSVASWRGAWGIIGLICVIVTIVQLICFRKGCWNDLSKLEDQHVEVDLNESEEMSAATKKSMILMAILVIIVLFLSEGVNTTVGNLITSYMVEYLGISDSLGALCVSAYSISIFCARILSGLIIVKVGTKMVIRGGLLLAIIGTIIGIFAGSISPILVVVGVVMIGGGMGPLAPSFASEAIFRFSGKIAQKMIGIQLCAMSFGSSCTAWIVAILIEKFGYSVLFPALVVIVGIMICGNEIIRGKERNSNINVGKIEK